MTSQIEEVGRTKNVEGGGGGDENREEELRDGSCDHIRRGSNQKNATMLKCDLSHHIKQRCCSNLRVGAHRQ